MNKLFVLVSLTIILNCTHISGQLSSQGYTLGDTLKAIACYDSAAIYFTKADSHNAKRNYLNALAIYKSLYGEGHKRIASIYQKIALLELKASNNKLALDYMNKSLEINRKLYGEISKETAGSLGNLGITYERLEMLDKAEYFLNKAKAIYVLLFGENNKSVAAYYNNMGNMYGSKKDYYKAAEYQNKALSIRLKVLPPNHEDIAASYNNLANIFYNKGDFDLALEYEKKGLTIKQTIFNENHPAIAWSYNNIGCSYFEKGDYEKALMYQRKALDIRLKTLAINHVDIGSSYMNIGNIYERLSKFDSALFYQNKDLEISVNSEDKVSETTSIIYFNKGNIYMNSHKYDSAIVNYSKALETERKIFSKPSPQIADHLNHLADTYFAKGQVYKALDCLDSAFVYNLSDNKPLNLPDSVLLNNAIDHKIMMRTLMEKAGILSQTKDVSQGNLQKALVYLKEAIIEAEKAKSEITSENSKLYMGEDIDEICNKAVAVLYKLYNLSQDNSYITDAFYFFEKSKASVLLESLLKPKSLLRAGIPEQVIQKERSFRSNITYYETKRETDANNQNPLKENIDSILFSIKFQNKEFLDSINAVYPQITGLLKESKIADINDIQKKLPASSTLVEYFAGKEKTYALIITPDKKVFFELPSDTSLASRIKSFLTSIRKNNQELTYKEGYWLYKSLIGPVVPMLKGAKNLLIIPDQILSSIPFEAIITGGSSSEPSYLIEKYTVTYQLSASIWLDKIKSAKPEQTNNKNLLDFAGFAPVFKSDNMYAIATQRDDFAEKYGSDSTLFEPLRGQQYFRELPNSEKEVTQIASLFKQANRTAVTYTYGQSTKTAFKNEGPRYNILHIATHAFANNKEPELSWLAFANKDSTLINTQNDDGVLYAGEIYGLSLNASLIVLSACETGVGKVIKGEGIMSLSRSLMYAGASNIILSLWRVGDLDSKLLMIGFYKANISGKSYADALRAAKLSMLKKKSSPKSWAGFVLFGI